MSKSRILPRIFSGIFTAICTIGMLYQQITILNLFLQHKVTTTTSVYTPRVVEYLASTACFPLTVINLTLLNQETSSNWTKKDLYKDSLISTNSLATLLKYAPSGKSLIKYYAYTDPNRTNDKIDTMNFSCEQFIYGHHICYKFRLNSSPTISLEDAAGLGALGLIIFSDTLDNISGFIITFGSPEKIPVRDVITSRKVIKNGNATKGGASNIFQSNHYQIDRQSLPYPYESNCYDYETEGMNDEFECLNACFIKKSLEQLNGFPILAVILKDFNYTFVNTSYINNSTFYARLSSLKEGCRKKCVKMPCHDTQVVTLTDNGLYNENLPKEIKNMSFAIHHTIPFFPFVNITSRPSQSIDEFILYALSSVSTWTGLSIFALNPVRLLIRFFSKRHQIEALNKTSYVYQSCLFAMKKQHKKFLFLLALRDSQMKKMRHDLKRIERTNQFFINFLINSRLP